MTSPQPLILKRLKSVAAALQNSMGVLKAGDDIDLAGLEHEIADICKELATLPVALRKTCENDLVSLMADLDLMERQIRAEQDKLAGEIGEVSRRKQATNAYNADRNKPDK